MKHDELIRLLKSGCAVTPHQIQAAELIEQLKDEVKQECNAAYEQGQEEARVRNHHITDEQIDAAVAYADKELGPKVFHAVWLALNKLNIHRC